MPESKNTNSLENPSVVKSSFAIESKNVIVTATRKELEMYRSKQEIEQINLNLIQLKLKLANGTLFTQLSPTELATRERTGQSVVSSRNSTLYYQAGKLLNDADLECRNTYFPILVAQFKLANHIQPNPYN